MNLRKGGGLFSYYSMDVIPGKGGDEYVWGALKEIQESGLGLSFRSNVMSMIPSED